MGLFDIWAYAVYNPAFVGIHDALIFISIVFITLLYMDFIKKNNIHNVSITIFLIYFIIHIFVLFDYTYFLYEPILLFVLLIILIVSVIKEFVHKRKKQENVMPKTRKSIITTTILFIFTILLGVMLLFRQTLHTNIINYQIEKEHKEQEQRRENIQNTIDKLIEDEKYEELVEYCKENHRPSDLKNAYELLCKKYIKEKQYEKAYDLYYESVIKNKEADFTIDDEFPIEEKLKYIKEGDSIIFGGIGLTKYGLDVGKFPIRWYLLKREDGKKYFISSYILHPKEFDEKGNTSFAESSLRKFLNKYFCEKAFSDNEKEKMCANDSGDMVFLANEDDLSDKKFKFKNTAYSQVLTSPDKNKNSLDLSKRTAYYQELISPDVFWINGATKDSTENVAKTYNTKTRSTSVEDAKNFKVGVAPVICLK